MLDDCLEGKHQLIDIYCESKDFCSVDYVTRWCEICGSIVVNIDYDDRTNAGGFMKMMSPELFDKEKE